jgi:hypothetical protein
MVKVSKSAIVLPTVVCSSSRMAEHFTDNPSIKGLNPATGCGTDKMAKPCSIKNVTIHASGSSMVVECLMYHLKIQGLSPVKAPDDTKWQKHAILKRPECPCKYR